MSKESIKIDHSCWSIFELASKPCFVQHLMEMRSPGPPDLLILHRFLYVFLNIRFLSHHPCPVWFLIQKGSFCSPKTRQNQPLGRSEAAPCACFLFGMFFVAPGLHFERLDGAPSCPFNLVQNGLLLVTKLVRAPVSLFDRFGPSGVPKCVPK